MTSDAPSTSATAPHAALQPTASTLYPHQLAPSIGMLFQPDMIRALLGGTKTVTRRKLNERQSLAKPHWPAGRAVAELLCPYGAAGDWVYAKESFRLLVKQKHLFIQYVADHHIAPVPAIVARMPRDIYAPQHQPLVTEDGVEIWPLKPSIFLPRNLSRIGLLIKSVRVEPLDAMTDDDVAREGLPGKTRSQYVALWNQINPERPWGHNPPIQRIEFARVVVVGRDALDDCHSAHAALRKENRS